eukprot:Ihof_evm2s547 gene=Ihof_evmTU2s547
MAGWTIKIKTSSSNHIVKDLTGDSTVNELGVCIHTLTDIAPDRQYVKYGYPLKELSLVDPTATLSSLRLRSGETLIVNIKTSQPLQVNDSTPMANVEMSKDQSEPITRPIGQQDANNVIKATKYKTVNNSVLEQCPKKLMDGLIVRRPVAADNSCLFSSLSLVLLQDRTGASKMRQLVAQIIHENPIQYEGVLEKAPAEYCWWILQKDHWGGAVDIHILSQHYQTEIVVFDSQTLRIDQFGKDGGHKQRVMLIYDGIHYDPLVWTPYEGASNEVDTTIFDTSDNTIMAAALEVAKQAHK